MQTNMKKLLFAAAALALGAISAHAQDVAANFAKSDFVPGDEIFYDDDLEREKVGEYPMHWDLEDGIAEIAVIDGRKVIYFPDEGFGVIKPLMKTKNYLPDVFTFEFDLYVDKWTGDWEVEGKEHALTTEFYSEAMEEYSNGWVGNFVVGMRTHGDHYCSWSWCKPNLESGEQVGGDKELGLNPEGGWYNKKDNPLVNGWNHIAFSFNKRALKVYINGVRVVNIPNAAAPTYLKIRHDWDFANQGITNFRLAKGAVPLYDRLLSEGRFTTYGITFDSGKATIKPESMPEIIRIAKLMQEHPELNFEVQGHCDNTGSDRVNDPLSQQRADAIVKALIDQGIASNRLTAVGKGSHEPIADNSTEEGRARNRRVEFVKK